MKLVFTIANRLVDQGVLKGNVVKEIVDEDVAKFEFNEATQKITIYHNNGADEVIDLYTVDGQKLEQWFLLDIKCIQIPMKYE